MVDYIEYQRTGNKNLFEEIIDRMILDEVAGMNEQFREKISNLDSRKKRMAILSLLDKDRNLFTKIKALISENNMTRSKLSVKSGKTRSRKRPDYAEESEAIVRY